MIIGGGKNMAHFGFETVIEYDIDTDSYSYLPSLPFGLKWSKAVRSQNYMYVFGGLIELIPTNKVLRIALDSLHGRYTYLP